MPPEFHRGRSGTLLGFQIKESSAIVGILLTSQSADLAEVPVARVTVEDCLQNVNNRFALVILAAERARQLANGGKPLVRCTNKPAVTSLREIARSRVKFNESVETTVNQYLAEVKNRGLRPEKSARQRQTPADQARAATTTFR